MGQFRYSPDTIQKVIALKEGTDKTWLDIGNELDLPPERARYIYKTYKDAILTEDGPDNEAVPLLERAANIVYADKRKPEDLSYGDMLQACTDAQNARRKISYAQHDARVTIETDRPIAICCFSDTHIGSPYTDHAALNEDIGTIASDPRIYVLWGGDKADNFTPKFKDAGAVVGQLHPAQYQWVAVDKIMDALRGSIVASIGGNHDNMGNRVTGHDEQYFILRDKPFPHLPEGGLIKLTVGTTDYEILWKHTYRFRSALNQFNSHHRMKELLHPTADIVVQEHEHSPGIESLEVGEYESKRTVVNIRTGAYKLDDPFSMRYFKAGRRGPQTVILWPDRKKVLALHGEAALADAQTFLNGLNKHTTVSKSESNATKKKTT